jgi:hypothetical protein
MASSITIIIFASSYYGSLCVASGANGAFSILSYLAWVTSATLHGIELSKIKNELTCIKGISEKLNEVI